MTDPVSQSALVEVAELPLHGRGVVLEESSGAGFLNLRGDAGDAAFLAGAARAIDSDLPVSANRVENGAGASVYWLGPDEWLVRLASPQAARSAVERLAGELAGLRHACNDLSGAQVVLRLSGARSRDVLAQGCTLDLHPRVLQPGQCVQSLLAHAQMLLVPGDDHGTFDIIVRRSFADHLARWLIDACR